MLKGLKKLNRIQPLFKTLGHEIAKDETRVGGMTKGMAREIVEVQGLIKQQESQLKSGRIRKAAKAKASPMHEAYLTYVVSVDGCEQTFDDAVEADFVFQCCRWPGAEVAKGAEPCDLAQQRYYSLDGATYILLFRQASHVMKMTVYY